MNVSTRFLKASTALSGLALLAGCITPGGGLRQPIEYGTQPAQQRTADARASNNHVVVDRNGAPIAVNYDACRALRSTLKEMGLPTKDIERAANRGVRDITSDVRRGRDASDSLFAGGINIGLTYGINLIKYNMLAPRAQQEEGDCQQQNAYKSYEKDVKRYNQEFQRCVTGATKGRNGMSTQEAGQECRQRVRPLISFDQP